MIHPFGDDVGTSVDRRDARGKDPENFFSNYAMVMLERSETC